MSLITWFIENGAGRVKYFVAIPLLIGIIFYRRLSYPQRLVVGLLLVGGLAEIISKYIWRLESWENNMPVFHIYTAIEYYLVVSIFYFGVKGMISQKLYQFIMLGYSIFFALSLIFYQGIWDANSFSSTLSGIVLIVLSLAYFNFTLKHLNTPDLGQSFSFWFATTILLYFSANLLLFIFYDSIIEKIWEKDAEQSIFNIVWSMFSFMNLVMYLLFSIALLCKEPTPSSPSSSPAH